MQVPQAPIQLRQPHLPNSKCPRAIAADCLIVKVHQHGLNSRAIFLLELPLAEHYLWKAQHCFVQSDKPNLTFSATKSPLSISLDFQPIFYPVLNEEYATKIARDWNTKDAASGYVGYVTKFAVNSEYLSRFQVQTVGSADWHFK